MESTQTKDIVTQLKAEIIEHAAVNSFVNIVNWKFWYFGTCADADTAQAWAHENSEVKVRFFTTFDAKSEETAKEVVEIFVEQGSETTGPLNAPAPGPLVFMYKTFF